MGSSTRSIAISNQNLPPLIVARQKAAWFREVQKKVGADGYLWNAVRGLSKAGRELLLSGEVLRLQQSWRGERYRDLPGITLHIIRQARHEVGRVPHDDRWAERKRILAQAAVDIAMRGAVVLGTPHISTSLGRLNRFQAATLGQLPAIAHPNEQHLGSQPPNWKIDYPRHTRSFSSLSWQLTAEVAKARGISPGAPGADIMKQINTARPDGFTDEVLDFGHLLLTRNGQRFDDPDGIVKAYVQKGRPLWLQIGWQPGLAESPAEAEHVNTQLGLALSGKFEQTDQGRLLQIVNSNLLSGQGVAVDVEVAASLVQNEHNASYLAANHLIITQVRQSMPAAFG
jgi:hypothetical protein